MNGNLAMVKEDNIPAQVERVFCLIQSVKNKSCGVRDQLFGAEPLDPCPPPGDQYSFSTALTLMEVELAEINNILEGVNIRVSDRMKGMRL